MSKQTISKAIGIDLGTTNSVVAILDPTDTEIIIHRNPAKRETTPSCVWKDRKSGQIIVGAKAYSRIGSEPAPIRSIKRSMGKQRKVLLTDEYLTPEEISAHILREMKRQIEEDAARLGTDTIQWSIDRAVITVPAYFDQPQIEATRKAGELAGLEVLGVLLEPTAAAGYYCWKTGVRNGVFLVYDLGGGTFDVSVLRCKEGAFQVFGVSGDNFLGGDDIDAALADALLQRLQAEGYKLQLDINNNEEDRLRFDNLKYLMEGVKKELSTRDVSNLRDGSRIKDQETGQPINIETTFERYELEEIIRPIIEPTIPLCKAALTLAQEKAGVTLADVDAIILAGGSTHIPLVREMIRQSLCADPNAHEPRAKCSEPVYGNVDSIVALGAALHAATTGGLAVYNPERTVRLFFRGIGVASSAKTQIGGKVEALTQGIDLLGAKVLMSNQENGHTDQEPLRDDGSFAFTDVPLDGAKNHLTFEVYDQEDTLLLTADRSIVSLAGPKTDDRNPAKPTKGNGTPVDIIPATPQLPKPILLEINQGGKPYREELFPALIPLPAEKTFDFILPGNTDRIRLPLYYGITHIKDIPISIPSTLEAGTPVSLNLRIDEFYFITAKMKIEHLSFDFNVEDIPDRSMPTPEEVEALNEQVKEAIASLPTSEDRTRARREQEALRQNIDEAIRHGDHDRAEHLRTQMQGLLEVVTSTDETDGTKNIPTQEEFDRLVEECLHLNERITAVAGSRRPDDPQKIKQAIEEQQVKGKVAFASQDDRGYREAIKMLEHLRSHLSNQLLESIPPEQKAEVYLQAAKDALAEITDQVMAQGRSDLQKQVNQLQEKLDALDLLLFSDPQAVLRRIRPFFSDLNRVAGQLGSPDSELDDYIKDLLRKIS